jgi:hypothetical protein
MQEVVWIVELKANEYLAKQKVWLLVRQRLTKVILLHLDTYR